MTSNIITGIDEVIKGLTTIKGAIMASNSTTAIIGAVKEAVAEVLTDVQSDVAEVTKEVKKIEKKAEVVEEVEPEVQEEVQEVENIVSEITDLEIKRAELEEMKYNDLKTLASSLDLSAIGKKVDLIERILEFYADGGVLDEEEEQDIEPEEVQNETEESEDVADEQEEDEQEDDPEEFVEFLEELDLDEIKELAEEVGLKAGKKVKAKLIEELVEDLDKLVKALEALGYYAEEVIDEDEDEDEPVEALEEVTNEDEDEDEQEHEEDEETSIAKEYGLNEYTVEELADICDSFELSTKGKKQALIDRIVKGIMDGTIEFEDDDDDVDVEEDDEEVESQEEKTPLKKLSESENPIVIKKEAEVEADIREKYEKGNLKDSAIKKFLDKYNEGDPECAGCKDCSKEDMLECYIDIHKGLVDDDGDLNEFEEPYMRGEEYFCCGREIKELENGNLYCQVCGHEYME